MSNKSRYRRTADPRHPRRGDIGMLLAIAAGGALAAAFASIGTASADDLVGPAASDVAVTDLTQAIDPTVFTAASTPADVISGAAAAAALPAATLDAFESLILSLDPNAFNSTGVATDTFGTIAVQIDTDLADLPAPSIGPPYLTELNTIATQVTCAMNPTCEPTLLITPPATGDDGFTILEQFVAANYIPQIAPIELAPLLDSDLATIASDLDAYFADTVYGPELYVIAEQIIAAL